MAVMNRIERAAVNSYFQRPMLNLPGLLRKATLFLAELRRIVKPEKRLRLPLELILLCQWDVDRTLIVVPTYNEQKMSRRLAKYGGQANLTRHEE